jgi:hypothetical protein
VSLHTPELAANAVVEVNAHDAATIAEHTKILVISSFSSFVICLGKTNVRQNGSPIPWRLKMPFFQCDPEISDKYQNVTLSSWR